MSNMPHYENSYGLTREEIIYYAKRFGYSPGTYYGWRTTGIPETTLRMFSTIKRLELQLGGMDWLEACKELTG